MTPQEHLLYRAHYYWDHDLPLPLDLFYEMLGAGIDVAEEERVYNLNMEQFNDGNN